MARWSGRSFYETILTGEFDFEERCRPEAPDRRAPRRRRHARRVRRLPPRPAQGRPPRHPGERPRRAHARGVPPAVALPCRPRPQRHRRVGPRAGRRPALLGARRPVPRQGDPADRRALGPRARRAGRARGAAVGPRRRGRARGRRPARPRGRPVPRGHPRRRGRGDPHRRGVEVRLDADTLGALYLGGVRAETLRRAGRLSGTEAGLATWAAMVDAGPAPYCITGF